MFCLRTYDSLNSFCSRKCSSNAASKCSHGVKRRGQINGWQTRILYVTSKQLTARPKWMSAANGSAKMLFIFTICRHRHFYTFHLFSHFDMAEKYIGVRFTLAMSSMVCRWNFKEINVMTLNYGGSALWNVAGGEWKEMICSSWNSWVTNSPRMKAEEESAFGVGFSKKLARKKIELK